MLLLSTPQEDKIGSLKAAELLKKVQVELAKRSGYRVKQTVDPFGVADSDGQGPTLDGVIKKDFAAIKGMVDKRKPPIEVYAKGTLRLVRDAQGKFVEPKELDDVVGMAAANVRNPAVIAAEILRFSGAAAFTGDGKVGELDCRILETWADVKSTEEQLKELVNGLPAKYRDGLRLLLQSFDTRKSTAAYKAWVGKGTLLFHRIEWTMTAIVDKQKIQKVEERERAADKYEGKIQIEIQDYDTGLDVEVPKEIRARFGVK